MALGVYRSASTWAANVATELLRGAGSARLVYADSVAVLAPLVGDGATVVKTHLPDAGLKLLIHVARLPVIVTVRDPGDCVASLMEQFRSEYDRAVGGVAFSCRSLLDTLPLCDPLILRYEDAAARGANDVAAIAGYLDVTISRQEAEALAARFAPDAVRSLIERFTAEGVFGEEPAPHHVHDQTQWHPGHLGTGLSGEQHRLLTAEQVAQVRANTGPFRERFGYAAPRSDAFLGRIAMSGVVSARFG